MIQEGLYALLNANLPLIAGNVHPMTLPDQFTLPAMVYTRISRTSEPTFEDQGMQKVRMQFDVYSEVSPKEAATIGNALEAFLDSYSGTLSDGTFLQYAEFITDSDQYDDVPRQFRFMAEYYLWYAG